jgi:N-acetylglucosamine-6-phosphate deacetylase
MSGALTSFVGAKVFDGKSLLVDHALLTEAGRVVAVLPQADLPQTPHQQVLTGGILMPGYVDLQVNGGGGVMFNDDPSPEALNIIAKAHCQIGATSILPTLITDSAKHTAAAINAVEQALASGARGILGLHLEGPHLSLARKGAHDPRLIRAMSAEDMAVLLDAAKRLPLLKITVAPETVTPAQIKTLAAAGVLISLGHSDAGFDLCQKAAEAGARCVTHLFNAMSPLGNREPGLVGAALAIGGLSAGLIADTIHVHPQSMALALRAKQGPGRVFLVSDAMATAGSEIDGFALNGRWITRSGNKLTLDDGTLAGAQLDLTTAIRNVLNLPGQTLPEVLAMATAYPAQLIGQQGHVGALTKGARADLLHLSDDLTLCRIWQADVQIK